MTTQKIIHIHAQAPAKPALGEPCNGCGVCCLAEPCPVGMVVSRKRKGACKALVWDGANSRYLCGLLQPRTSGITRWFKPWFARMIAAGRGCDAALEVDRLDV